MTMFRIGARVLLRSRTLSGVSGSAWVVLAGDALSALGSGLTLPFLFVYLHAVRGINAEYAGLAVAALAAAGLIGNPLGGWLSDRTRPRAALIVGLLTAAGGAVTLAAVHSVWQALAASCLAGLGAAIIWPAQDALLAAMAEPAQRSTVFTVRHATMNVGLGVGAALAGLLARLPSARSFQLLYLLDAATFLAFIPVLLLSPALRRTTQTSEPSPRSALEQRTLPGGERRAGFRHVLADRSFRCLWLITLLIGTAGGAQLHSAFPAYATETGHLSAGALAAVYAFNSCAVVLLQLPVLHFLRGRLRTRGLALVGLSWAAAWALTLAGGQHGGTVWCLTLLAAAMGIFALGETCLAPTAAPLVNGLAPDHLRGRYNGLYVLAWTIGSICGPTMTGFLLAKKQATALFAACIVLLLIATVITRRLAQLTPTTVNRIPADTAVMKNDGLREKELPVVLQVPVEDVGP